MQTMQPLTATPVLAGADTSSALVLGAHALDLDLGIEELDSMVAPWDWGDFGEGFKVGLTIAGLGAAGAGIAAT